MKSFMIILLILIASSLLADVPPMMNYQGILTDDTGQPVADDIYEIVFRIYTQETGGSPVWSETQNVSTTDGIFHVLLGSLNPITNFPSDNAWLAMRVELNQEMTPRKRIASVAYSFKSGDSEYLQGYNANDFVMSSEYCEPITVYGHVASVACQPSEWTTLLEVDITIPETMMIMSFGTVSGTGWVDGWRMLQLSIYNYNYTQFYGYANPWGEVAVAYHILGSGTYHIQLYGVNMNDYVANITNISIFAYAVRSSSKESVRNGPFPPPENAILPDPIEIKK